MLDYIRGRAVEKLEDSLVAESGQIGFHIFVPAYDLEEITIGSDLKLYVHLDVKEHGWSIYGFNTKIRRDFFRELISVNGVGPKAGLSLLDVNSASDLRNYILNGDVKAISKAKGIGKKTAERLIVELHRKIDIKDLTESPRISVKNKEAEDAKTALEQLGYDSANVAKFINNRLADKPELEAEEIIRSFLSESSKR